jgi:DNA-binding XRE family transcriptional regulator
MDKTLSGSPPSMEKTETFLALERLALSRGVDLRAVYRAAGLNRYHYSVHRRGVSVMRTDTYHRLLRQLLTMGRAASSPGLIERAASDQGSLEWTDFLTRLARRRTSLGYSQIALAGKIGVDDHLVAKWECGIRTPEGFLLFCWMQALGLSLAVPGTESPPEPAVRGLARRRRGPRGAASSPIAGQSLAN